MKKNNLTSDDVAYLVPHQANMRIIDATAKRMGLSKDKVMVNIDRYGNTTAATRSGPSADWLQPAVLYAVPGECRPRHRAERQAGLSTGRASGGPRHSAAARSSGVRKCHGHVATWYRRTYRPRR